MEWKPRSRTCSESRVSNMEWKPVSQTCNESRILNIEWKPVSWTCNESPHPEHRVKARSLNMEWKPVSRIRSESGVLNMEWKPVSRTWSESPFLEQGVNARVSNMEWKPVSWTWSQSAHPEYTNIEHYTLRAWNVSTAFAMRFPTLKSQWKAKRALINGKCPRKCKYIRRGNGETCFKNSQLFSYIHKHKSFRSTQFKSILLYALGYVVIRQL